jgi:hypothetical protein
MPDHPADQRRRFHIAEALRHVAAALEHAALAYHPGEPLGQPPSAETLGELWARHKQGGTRPGAPLYPDTPDQVEPGGLYDEKSGDGVFDASVPDLPPEVVEAMRAQSPKVTPEMMEEAAKAAKEEAKKAYGHLEEWQHRQREPNRVKDLQADPVLWFTVLEYYLAKALEVKADGDRKNAIQSLELMPGGPNDLGREWRDSPDVDQERAQTLWDSCHKLLDEGKEKGIFDADDETQILLKLGSPREGLREVADSGSGE